MYDTTKGSTNEFRSSSLDVEKQETYGGLVYCLTRVEVSRLKWIGWYDSGTVLVPGEVKDHRESVV